MTVCVTATNAVQLSASQCAEDTFTWDTEAPRPLSFRPWDSGRATFVRTGVLTPSTIYTIYYSPRSYVSVADAHASMYQ